MLSSAPTELVPPADGSPSTYFAPPERATQALVRLLSTLTLNDPIVRTILEAVGGHVLILNAQRQILAASREVLEALGLKEMDSLLGLRPGEAFSCDHVKEGPNGCGTAPYCRHCGAVLAILAGQASGIHADGECCLTMRKNGERWSAEYRVRATPLVVGTTPVVVLVLHDNSALKRREVLERVFFHDTKNIMSGLIGWSEELARESTSEAAHTILSLSERLNEELTEHALLLQAEQRTLLPQRIEVVPGEFFAQIRTIFEHHPSAAGKTLAVDLPAEPHRLATDPTILKSVLVNMVKNAFEASKEGGRVVLRFALADDRPRFSTHNDGAMSPETAALVFTRSFTTKQGHGRGIGSYSMRLLGEQFLGGTVSFTSTPAEGTTFFLELPATDLLRHAAAQPE
jgi:hypothetical protein